MNTKLIFLPILLQIALVVVLYFKLASVKKAAVAAGEVDEKRRGLYDDAWPASVQQVNNCIRNQFEVPILFYVLIGMLWALDSISLAVHGLAWVFIVSRLAHAYVQVTSNVVPIRRRYFTYGVLAVMALALIALVSIFI